MSSFTLVSAPFSCGISWVVSVLMELGIRTTHAEPKRYPNGFWNRIPGRDETESIVPEGVAHMRYYLPMLHEKNEFRFREPVEVSWEHRLDFARSCDRPVMIFVRDPRDAIRSLYERNYLHFTWNEYLQRPDRWPDHFPGLFDLPPAETWAVWHAFWLSLAAHVPLRVWRFEDSRLQPHRVVQEMVDFLGVRRSSAEIDRAVKASTFERTKAAMEKAESESGVPFRVARRGKVGEWEEIFDEEALRAFGGPTATWMQKLGYAPAAASIPSGTEWSLPVSQESDRVTDSWQRPFLDLWRRSLMAEARECLRQGVVQFTVQGNQSPAHLRAIAAWVAFDWTHSIFGESLLSTPNAQIAFRAFDSFLCQFGLWPSVRAMLQRALEAESWTVKPVVFTLSNSDSNSAASSVDRKPTSTAPQKPVLIEPDYKGYRILGYAGVFYAVSNQVPQLDLVNLSKEAFQAHRQQKTVFAGDMTMDVKESVDRHGKAA